MVVQKVLTLNSVTTDQQKKSTQHQIELDIVEHMLDYWTTAKWATEQKSIFAQMSSQHSVIFEAYLQNSTKYMMKSELMRRASAWAFFGHKFRDTWGYLLTLCRQVQKVFYTIYIKKTRSIDQRSMGHGPLDVDGYFVPLFPCPRFAEKFLFRYS